MPDTDTIWICPRCGTRNHGVWHSHQAKCGGDGCHYRLPRAGDFTEEINEMTAINHEIEEARDEIRRLKFEKEHIAVELGEIERDLERTQSGLLHLLEMKARQEEILKEHKQVKYER